MDCLTRFFDLAFFRDFASNLLSTLLGLAIGIPIALWINRVAQANQQKAEDRARSEEAAVKKKEVLGIIRAELAFNLAGIEGLKELWPQDSPSGEMLAESFIIYARLKDETWRVFSQSGELAWVNDPAILDFISHAYFQVRRGMAFWDRLFSMKFIGGSNLPDEIITSIEEALLSSVDQIMKSIQLAIDTIDNHIEPT